MRTDLGRTIWGLICSRDRISVESTGGSASIRRWCPWILAMKPFKNWIDLGCRYVLICLSLILNVYYVRSIITIILPLSPVNQQWPLYIFNIKKMHSSRVVKRLTRFWMQVWILILHLSFMPHIFTLCFNQFQYLHFVCHQIMLCCMLAVFYMSHFLPLFVKLLTLLVGFELTTLDDLLSIDSNGKLRTCIVICIFIFKFELNFVNSEHLIILCITWVQTLFIL